MVAIASLCVFCGSSTPPDTRYSETARALGTLLARSGIGLIYGGGRGGVLGGNADGAPPAGGRGVGVLPTGPLNPRVGHPGPTQPHERGSVAEREHRKYDLR